MKSLKVSLMLMLQSMKLFGLTRKVGFQIVSFTLDLVSKGLGIFQASKDCLLLGFIALDFFAHLLIKLTFVT